MRLANLMKKAAEDPNGDIYFDGIEIFDAGLDTEYYHDPRTKQNEEGLQVVIPFCSFGGQDWYICPDCCQIEAILTFGKSQTRCCLDIDCQRLLRLNGEMYLIQRTPIIVDDNEIY